MYMELGCPVRIKDYLFIIPLQENVFLLQAAWVWISRERLSTAEKSGDRHYER